MGGAWFTARPTPRANSSSGCARSTPSTRSRCPAHPARRVQTENNAIYGGSLGSEEAQRVLPAGSSGGYSPPGCLPSVRDGTLLAQRFDAAKLELAGEPVTVAERVRHSVGNALADFYVSGNGVLVYYAGEEVKTQLTWFDRGGKQIATVGQPGSYVAIRLSPDDKHVAL